MFDTDLTLHDYWRSSACYRVRIALNLKGLRYKQKTVHLIRDGGEQHSTAHRELNPQETVPVLTDGGRVIRQSLAIIEYLEETWPGPPTLLPTAARDRAHVRGLALLVACDIHPLNNLRVLQYLKDTLGVSEEAKNAWYLHWIELGLSALEAEVAASAQTGLFCHGDTPTLADVCLVPQLANARRLPLPLDPYPTLLRIESNCQKVHAFANAAPAKQPDAS
jgi:maleylacetoacetate isomerase